MQSIKCVVVGDGGVGKTSLLMSYTSNNFPRDYVPTIFDNYNAPVIINDKIYNLGLWDTAGQEEYDKMRIVSYPHTDVFVLCFSLVGPSSFENIKNRWCPELRHHCPDTPVLLVGTKADLAMHQFTIDALARQNQAPTTRKQAEQLTAELKLAGYVECSGLTQKGIKTVFEEASRLAISSPASPYQPHAQSNSKLKKRKNKNNNENDKSDDNTNGKGNSSRRRLAADDCCVTM